MVPRGVGVSWRWCLVALVPRGVGQRAAVLWREIIAGNNPFLLLVAVHVGYFRESKPKLFSPLLNHG